jgi:hypothetical protein
MRTVKWLFVATLILATMAPSFGAIYVNDFAATKQTWVGRGLYASNSNYGTLRFGRIAKLEMDTTIMDFDRAAMLTWAQSVYSSVSGGTITDINQIGNGALTVTVYATAYDGWEESGVIPPTVFGHYFWPGVRLSKGQNWVESTATYNNAAAGAPWHDSAGNSMANIYVNRYDMVANMVLNANSEQWGAADTIGGGADVYVYDTPRPWKLDQTVAWAALTNPDAVGFQMIGDIYNKPYIPPTTDADDCNGTIYGRLHGLTEYRPYVEITVDTTKIGGPVHTYLPADFNHDLKVSFADYLILEANFGKSNLTNAQGDANSDGKCSFADYLVLESEFGHTTTPEPATMGLLVLGGLGLLRKRG